MNGAFRLSILRSRLSCGNIGSRRIILVVLGCRVAYASRRRRVCGVTGSLVNPRSGTA